MDNKEKLKRILWLDSIRGMSFLMVIYAHCKLFDHSILNLFAPVFLTSFFFVSGYLFKTDCSFLKILEQRTRTLFIPQLVMGLMIIGMTQIITFKDYQQSFSEQIIGLLIHYPGNHGLWFVAALFTYSILFYWLVRWIKKDSILIVVGLILYVLNWFYGYVLQGPALPYYIHGAGYALFYMSLGNVYRYFEPAISVRKKWLMLPLSAIYLIFVLATKQKYSIEGSPYLIDGIFVTCLGLYIFLEFSKTRLACNKAILFVGSNSLLYFGFHGKVLSFLETILRKICYDSGLLSHNIIMDELLRLCITVVVALFVAVFVVVANKWLPWLSGKGYKLWNFH